MRIRMYLPRVEPDKYDMPTVCPYDECEGEHFKLHQRHCRRAVLDPEHDEVEVRRYRCLSCRRTFRVYPCGVSRAQRSDRLRGIGIMLYVLGLSYGAVEDALFALGLAGSKGSVYRDVQEAGEAVHRLVDQGALADDAQLQAKGVGAQRLQPDLLPGLPLRRRLPGDPVIRLILNCFLSLLRLSDLFHQS